MCLPGRHPKILQWTKGDEFNQVFKMKAPNKKQIELLKSVSFGEEEWEKDIIWIKRMDAVSDPKKQLKVDKLFEKTIIQKNLHSHKEKEFSIISEGDNVWDSQRLNKQNLSDRSLRSKNEE